MRRAGRNEHKGSRSTAQGTLAATQIDFTFEDVKNFLDLGVIVRTGIESGRNREFEQRALFRMLRQ